MKVGIMTLYHNNFNFGGQLQAFALQKAITDLGHQCHVIDYSVEIKQNIAQKVFRSNIKDLIKRINQKVLYYLKIKTDQSFCKNIALREKKFRDFMESIPHTNECNSGNIRLLFGDKFDACIVGSDQVWNPKWWDASYFLDFVTPNTKKIAYAVSLNVNKISALDANYLREKTHSFKAISLREVGAKELLDQIIEKQLCITLDPTLLFQREFWDEIAVTPQIDIPYVLVYFPGGKTKSAMYNWHDFCKKEGYKLLTFPHYQGKYRLEDEQYSDIKDYCSGPAEFLGLIKGAKYILTGSFHATIFSILFKKQFISFRKEKESDLPAEVLRNGSLLKCLGLEERLVKHDWIPQRSLLDKRIDYDETEKRLSILRDESKDFLKKALEG